MSTILTTINGYKTYILCALGVLIILVNHFVGQVPGTPSDSPDWLSQIYQLLLVATGRSALSKMKETP